MYYRPSDVFARARLSFAPVTTRSVALLLMVLNRVTLRRLVQYMSQIALLRMSKSLGISHGGFSKSPVIAVAVRNCFCRNAEDSFCAEKTTLGIYYMLAPDPP